MNFDKKIKQIQNVSPVHSYAHLAAEIRNLKLGKLC
jgi:hypothetical protein